MLESANQNDIVISNKTKKGEKTRKTRKPNLI